MNRKTYDELEKILYELYHLANTTGDKEFAKFVRNGNLNRIHHILLELQKPLGIEKGGMYEVVTPIIIGSVGIITKKLNEKEKYMLVLVTEDSFVLRTDEGDIANDIRAFNKYNFKKI